MCSFLTTWEGLKEVAFNEKRKKRKRPRKQKKQKKKSKKGKRYKKKDLPPHCGFLSMCSFLTTCEGLGEVAFNEWGWILCPETLELRTFRNSSI